MGERPQVRRARGAPRRVSRECVRIRATVTRDNTFPAADKAPSNSTTGRDIARNSGRNGSRSRRTGTDRRRSRGIGRRTRAGRWSPPEQRTAARTRSLRHSSRALRTRDRHRHRCRRRRRRGRGRRRRGTSPAAPSGGRGKARAGLCDVASGATSDTHPTRRSSRGPGSAATSLGPSAWLTAVRSRFTV